MAITEPDPDYVMRTVRARGVGFVRLRFVDVAGLLKNFAIPVSKLEEALEDGVGIDGSSLEGGARRSGRDAIAHPGPRSFQILPWRPESLVACNPYLALALLLAAGLRGLEQELEPPPEATDGGLDALPRLPRDLREATDLLVASALAREAFGAELCDLYMRSRQAEWEADQAEVTEFERERLLRVL
jgi:glutamine synthetase